MADPIATDEEPVTTVRDALVAVGMEDRPDGEVVLASITGKGIRHYTLATVGDADPADAESLYVASGLFAPGVVSIKGGRTTEHVTRVVWLPFDADLIAMLDPDKITVDDLHAAPQEEIDDILCDQVVELDRAFAACGFPLHRLDYTGYGLCAYVYLQEADQTRVVDAQRAHKMMVAALNAAAGFALVDRQVSDAGPRITRVPGSRNRKGMTPRMVRTLRPWDGRTTFLDTPPGPVPAGRTPVDVPVDGDGLPAEAVDGIVDALAPSWSEGQRHAMGVAVAGLLAKSGVPESQALDIVARLAASDRKPYDRFNALRRSYERVRAGQPVAGYTALEGLLPPERVRRVADILDRYQESIAAKPDMSVFSPPDAVSDGALALTDMGNAERLVRQHGGDVRYSYALARWHVWDGTRYQEDDSGHIERRAKETVRTIYGEAAGAEDANARKALVKHAVKSEGSERVAAMIKMARSEPTVPVGVRALDADPWLFNVRNGTLDLRTGRLGDHRQSDLITRCAPIRFDRAATCPRFLAFLDWAMDGNAALVRFLQRAAGYSLTGNTSERIILILHGSGKNGKSTLLEVIRSLMGDYAARTPTDTLLKRREQGPSNDVARLRGVRFVSASEAEEGQQLAESKIKDLTGGDTISARFMYGEFFEFRPAFKLWLSTNHKPGVKGTDRAIWDRIKLVPFDVRVSPEDMDRGLHDKLMAEAPGILNWAIEGCLAWQRDGLGEPQAVSAATDAYRQEMDPLAGFFDDRITTGASQTCTAQELYAAYKMWCEANGEHPMTQTMMGRKLLERGFVNKNTGATRTRTWAGLSVRAGWGS